MLFFLTPTIVYLENKNSKLILWSRGLGPNASKYITITGIIYKTTTSSKYFMYPTS